MANDVKNTSSKVYRLLSDRCSLRVESAANPLRCCLSWRRACEVRRRGPAGRVRGHRMTGGTPKEVHWTAEQQKRPQRTYRGRKCRETAAQGSTTGVCFRPKMSCLSTPPKIRLRGAGADLTKIQPAGIRTKSGGARSIEGGKGPAGSGLSLGVAGVENGGRKDATFLRPPW